MPRKLIATSLALTAFAGAIIAGLLVDNPATTIVLRALVAMILCYGIGWILGAIAQRSLEEHVEQYKREHPLDLEPKPSDAADAPAESKPSMEPPGASPAMTAGAAERAAPSVQESPYAPPNDQAAA